MISLDSVIVWPFKEESKVRVAPLGASITACRKEPAPEFAELVTCAGPAAYNVAVSPRQTTNRPTDARDEDTRERNGLVADSDVIEPERGDGENMQIIEVDFLSGVSCRRNAG